MKIIVKTVNIRAFGIVQGVGFRPFTALAAEELGITGTVANKGSYVDIFATGEEEVLYDLADRIRHEPPERAMVLEVDVSETEYTEFAGFEIIESEKEYGDIFVSPDIATCDKCRAELFDKTDRRYLHPFINCTQCGPRLTILDTMPYDRERTTMREHPMCEKCAAEYHDPATRRFDAQPVCCNECGPEVYIVGTDIRRGEAITYVRRAIMEGRIIAVKGIGGFHLCCDAHNEEAVSRLRKLKDRPAKPFAVMLKDMGTVLRECHVRAGQEACLTGWQKPIMLLKKRSTATLSPLIAPDNTTVGVMLPYAPVQMLLFDYPDDVAMTDSLVMTSGNVRGAPICRSDEDAVKEIGGFCDLILSHNRKILLRADDSVTDWLFGRPYMIRRSRGFAPLPFMLKNPTGRQVLAIGGELKNSFCIARGDLLYPSPYVGDMADIRTVNALEESTERMCGLLEAEPEVIVCDTHPKYNTVRVAEDIAKKRGIPLLKVQHHYAHILSCMAENAYEGKVIGVSFDGTGYGDDGTVWGGELLVCDYRGYTRAGSIRPFSQTGGDLSSKEGWRIASALLRDAFGDGGEVIAQRLGVCDTREYRLQKAMAEKGLNTVGSTSCGRLFDAVSAILGIRRASTFEGEASTALMCEAERFLEEHPTVAENYRRPEKLIKVGENYVTLCTTALAADIAERKLAGSRTGAQAYTFHAVLADMVEAACGKISSDTGIKTVALSGGVFQNRLLTRLCRDRLEKNGFTVLLHSLVPPNDGGIALGQAAYGIYNS
ncbi:carbamoyltransferase HypF [Ruminococcus sp.]|uniref:carbamoyltransferase HypF n=1 Tax=Ruminococcus sp. TaxID=41978 RepID=UPI0034178C68